MTSTMPEQLGSAQPRGAAIWVGAKNMLGHWRREFSKGGAGAATHRTNLSGAETLIPTAVGSALSRHVFAEVHLGGLIVGARHLPVLFDDATGFLGVLFAD